MYGKFFASTFTGSMFGAGPDVFAVWGYVIAHAVDSVVEVNPVMLAPMLGSSVKRIEAALKFLCDPDPRSRNPEFQGRRMIHQSGFQYHIPSHETYLSIRNQDERREYNREAQQRVRDKTADGKTYVYFARDERRLVKIGFSSNPVARIKGSYLKDRGAVGEVELLAVVEGDRDDERLYRERFATYMDPNGWFRLEGELDGFLRTGRVIDHGVRVIDPHDHGVRVKRVIDGSSGSSGSAHEEEDLDTEEDPDLGSGSDPDLRSRSGSASGVPSVTSDRLLKLWRAARSSQFGGLPWGDGPRGNGTSAAFIKPENLREAAELISATQGAAPFVQRSMERFWSDVKAGKHRMARACARQPAFAFGAWLGAFPGDVEEYMGIEHPPEPGQARPGRLTSAEAAAAFLRDAK